MSFRLCHLLYILLQAICLLMCGILCDIIAEHTMIETVKNLINCNHPLERSQVIDEIYIEYSPKKFEQYNRYIIKPLRMMNVFKCFNFKTVLKQMPRKIFTMPRRYRKLPKSFSRMERK